MKWAELSQPWQACLEETWAAYRAGTVPVGAVVVDESGQVVSRGRNRIRDQQAPPRQACDSQLAHAELNALLELGGRPEHIHDYAIYTAVEPCPLCLGAIYMSGVRSIFFATDDAYAGATDLLGKTWYLARKPVRVSGPLRGGLAEFACALHIEFCIREYGADLQVVGRERQVFPEGVALAEKLLAEDFFRQAAAENLSAAQAFERITA